MSKKHYIAAAEMISKERANAFNREEVAEMFADLFEADNPNFDREFFMAACAGGRLHKPRT